jgi:hypothetical protein
MLERPSLIFFLFALFFLFSACCAGWSLCIFFLFLSFFPLFSFSQPVVLAGLYEGTMQDDARKAFAHLGYVLRLD